VLRTVILSKAWRFPTRRCEFTARTTGEAVQRPPVGAALTERLRHLPRQEAPNPFFPPQCVTDVLARKCHRCLDLLKALTLPLPLHAGRPGLGAFAKCLKPL